MNVCVCVCEREREREREEIRVPVFKRHGIRGGLLEWGIGGLVGSDNRMHLRL